MPVSATGGVAAVSRLARAGGAGFVPPVSPGLGPAAPAHRTVAGRMTEAAASGTTPAHPLPATLADDTRALVGDVFGALGARTPTATAARQAVEAYRRAG